MNTDFSNIAGMFKFNTDIVNTAVSDVTAKHWFQKPGEDSNHLMWVMGHLIVHRGRVLQTLGINWDSAWTTLFARGSERVEDAAYPGVEEVLNAWKRVSDELSSALREPVSDVLAQPAPKGPPSFDGTVSGTVAFFAFHDTYHVGQVSYLRKWLGYGQTVG